VSVNLLRTRDGRSIWTESFDVPASEVFQVQDQVSEAVVTRLRVHVDPGQHDRMMKRYTENAEAYAAFTLGRSAFDKAGPGSSPESLHEAIHQYERAIALDPRYALAHAHLAAAYLWTDFFFEPGAGYLEKAKAQAAEADRLDPQLAETRLVRYQLAFSHYENWDIEGALREVRAAQGIDPSAAHPDLAILYAHMGLLEPFRREIERARTIDPSSESTNAMHLESLVILGLADEAIAFATQRRVTDGASRLALSYLALGRYDEARAASEALLAATPGHHFAVAVRELVAVASGERVADEAALAKAVESSRLLRDHHHTLYVLACIRSIQGDARRAVEMLRQAAAAGLPNRPAFLTDTLLAKARTSPEFATFDAELEPVWRRYEREAAAP
jgi:adenylate cyclase